LNDDGNSIKGNVTTMKYDFPNITVNLKGFNKYEISGLTGCSNIDTGTADIVYWKNEGGIAGVSPEANAKCNCLDHELN
jgi:hypothetical protein